jgi:hypothetical protein
MGADLLTAGWWTPAERAAPDDDQIRQVLRIAIRQERLRPEYSEREYRTTLFLEDFDEVPTVPDVAEVLLPRVREFFASLQYRDVSWNVYTDGDTAVRYALTGGMSWGDDPSETWTDWIDLWTILEDIAPDALAGLGVFFSPFEAAAAAREDKRTSD